MARTRLEIEEELDKLKDLRHSIPPKTAFDDSNEDAIEAQIKVIEQRFTFEQVFNVYEDEGDYILSNAMDALRWLEDDDEPVSDSWRELVNVEAELIA